MIIDVIKCEYDVMYIRCHAIRVPNVNILHTCCDVIDRAMHRYRCVCHLCDVTDIVAVMSNMVGEMSGIGIVLS